MKPKYTIEYCKANKVAIKVNKKQYEKLISISNSKKPEAQHYDDWDLSWYATFGPDVSHYDIRIWSECWLSLPEYVIISFEEFMRDNTEELPPNFYIRVTEKNYSVVNRWWCETYTLKMNVGEICGIYRDNFGEYKKGWTHGKIKGDGFDFGEEISFETFKKLVMKKPIGYKAPYDLYKGDVKKGTIFSKYTGNGKEMYVVDGVTTYYVPTEIVESWEPVFTFPPVVISSGDEVVVSENVVKVRNNDIAIHDVKRLLLPCIGKIGEWDVKIEDVTYKIGCTKVTKTDIEKIVNTHQELTK